MFLEFAGFIDGRAPDTEAMLDTNKPRSPRIAGANEIAGRQQCAGICEESTPNTTLIWAWSCHNSSSQFLWEARLAYFRANTCTLSRYGRPSSVFEIIAAAILFPATVNVGRGSGLCAVALANSVVLSRDLLGGHS
jgi:hypothetical protein